MFNCRQNNLVNFHIYLNDTFAVTIVTIVNSTTFNQMESIFSEELYRLINMSCHWSRITKSCLDWDSNPRSGNVEFKVELELAQYAELQHRLGTQSNHPVEEKSESALRWPNGCSNGCSLGSLLFLCQGNHVQKCVLSNLKDLFFSSAPSVP